MLYRELTFSGGVGALATIKMIPFLYPYEKPIPPLIAKGIGVMMQLYVFFFLFNLCFSPASVVSFITLCEMFYALGIWFQSGEGLVRILFRFDSHINKIAKKMKCKLEITAFLVVFISR